MIRTPFRKRHAFTAAFEGEPGTTRLSYFPLAAFIAVLGSAFASSVWLFQFVRDFPDPSGANGYFYLKQTESLAAGLGFYFKDRSLAFLMPVIFMKFTGNALLAFQISIAVVWFRLVSGTGFLVWNLTRVLEERRRLAVVVLATAALVSATPLYELTLIFFKNAFAVSLAIFALACWTSAWPRRVAHATALIFASLALLSHKSMLLVGFCFVVPWLARQASWKQRLWTVTGLGGIVGFFVWHFQNGREYLRAIAHSFTVPGPWWYWFSTLRWVNMEMFTAMLAIALIFVLAFFARRRALPAQKIFIDGACIFILVALQPFQLPGAEGPGYRMILLAPLFAIPLLALEVTLLPRRYFAVLLLFASFMAEPFMRTKHLDDVFTPWALLHDDVMKIKEFVRPEDHLTSHHGMEFFIDEQTGIRSRSFLSDHPEKRDFRVAFIANRWMRDNQAERAFRENALLEIGSEYVLLRESDWQSLSQRYHIPRHWKNPDSHRPDFIYE